MAAKEEYKCDICEKTFRDRFNLQRHKTSKICKILDREDLSEEKKKNPHGCRFCGRTFATRLSMQRHIRKSCKIAPRDGDTRGMDRLYDHVLQKQEEKLQEQEKKMQAMAAQIEELKAGGKPAVAIGGGANVAGDMKTTTIMGNGNAVDQSIKNITINIFGSEKTDHISHKDVLGLIQKLPPFGDDLSEAGKRLILSMAMKIFSDDKHPENITCYLPNKKGKEVMVHGASGWEVVPASLSLSPMASRSVDELFAKQPWPGQNGIDADAKMERPTQVLGYIKRHEGTLIESASAPSSELRAIPIRNKDLLTKALTKLPKAGDE